MVRQRKSTACENIIDEVSNRTGALGSWGAALLEPYSDKPDTKGIMRSSPDALETLVERFWKDGWSTVRELCERNQQLSSPMLAQNIHCIGDRANKVVLDIYERLLTRESKETGQDIHTIAERRRPRIEHAQIMQVKDLKRAGQLGGKYVTARLCPHV